MSQLVNKVWRKLRFLFVYLIAFIEIPEYFSLNHFCSKDLAKYPIFLKIY